MHIYKRSIRVIVSLFSWLILCSLLSSCVTIGEKTYYKNEDNYITVTATISYINIDYEYKELFIRFDGLPEECGKNNNFSIRGKNYDIVMENGIEDKIQLEKEVTFSVAPAVMGNGYFVPIVSITVDDEVLLEFEEGKDNLVAEYWYMWY